jgi:hypothetical protein
MLLLSENSWKEWYELLNVRERRLMNHGLSNGGDCGLPGKKAVQARGV